MNYLHNSGVGLSVQGTGTAYTPRVKINLEDAHLGGRFHTPVSVDI